MERLFLESIDAQDLENRVEAQIDFELLFDDGDEHVNADGNPDLGFHALTELPKNRLIWRWPLIHLKKSSICQRLL